MSVWPTWRFSRIQPMDTARESVVGEFFNNPEAIGTDVIALVREAIQNSLDQQVDPTAPVRVRIGIHSGEKSMASEEALSFFGGLQEHINAYGVSLKLDETKCDYLVFEDFNTGGLVGNPATTHDDGQKNDFMYFFRVEGKSRKQHSTDRGRWGIGKYVFSMSSSVNSFFGYSVRANDSYDQGHGLLFGKATMRLHSIEDVDFQPDGWWGLQEDAGQIVAPITEPGTIEEFRNKWNVTRRPQETGLSLVVPYLRGGGDSWSADALITAVVEEFFSPILRGQLVVAIESPSAATTMINELTLDDVVAGLSVEVTREELFSNIEALRWAMNTDPVVWDTKHDGAPAWQSAKILKERVEASRSAFDNDGRVLVRVPIQIHNLKAGKSSDSYVDIVVIDDANSRRAPLFIRSGIMIRQASRDKLNSARVVVLADDVSISGFLGDAEGPAHLAWSRDTEAFKGKYTNGPSWLTWAKQSPYKVLDLLRGEKSDPDSSIAEEFFPHPEFEKKSSGEVRPPGPPPLPQKPKLMPIISQIKGGVAVTFDPKSIVVPKVRVKIAYDVVRGNAFTKWHQGDFDLASMSSISVVDGTINARGGNQLDVSIEKQDSFALKMVGFDSNRDMRVEVSEV